MKRTLWTIIPILAIMLSLTTGCGKKARFEHKLIGKWEQDIEAYLNAMQEEIGIGASLISTTKALYEFNKDGTMQTTFTAMGRVQKSEIKWEITEVSGKKATVKIDDETCSISFISDDEIELTGNGDNKTRMKRVK
jgi:hypothetical protein